jgi:hypothetical protein
VEAMIASTTPEDQIGRVSAWFQAGNLAVGLSYSAFSAMALTAIGGSAAATGYNVFASLSNFPLWWLGGGVVRISSRSLRPKSMLITEAALGILEVAIFMSVEKALARRGVIAE